MKIELSQFIENENGSANCVLDMDAEGVEVMMRIAFKALLEHIVEITKEWKPDDSELSVGDTKRRSFDCGDGESEQSSKQEQYDLFPETLKVSS